MIEQRRSEQARRAKCERAPGAWPRHAQARSAMLIVLRVIVRNQFRRGPRNALSTRRRADMWTSPRPL